MEFSNNFLDYHVELNAIQRFIKLIKSSPDIIPSKLEDLNEFIYKHKIDGQTIKDIIDKTEKTGIVDRQLLFLALEASAEEYTESIEADIKEIIANVINDLQKDELKLNPTAFKIITFEEDLKLKSIKENAIYISIDNKVVCYTKLGLPKRNEQKSYDFFYVYLPEIYSSDDKPISKNDYNKYYRDRIQNAIKEIKHLPSTTSY